MNPIWLRSRSAPIMISAKPLTSVGLTSLSLQLMLALFRTPFLCVGFRYVPTQEQDARTQCHQQDRRGLPHQLERKNAGPDENAKFIKQKQPSDDGHGHSQ